MFTLGEYAHDMELFTHGPKITYKVHWRGGRMLEFFGSILVPLLTGSTIKGYSSNSALWAFEVLYSLFWHSFSISGHSMLWWMIVGANRLTWCRKCLRDPFWAWSCSSFAPRSFSLPRRTSFTVMLTIPLGGCWAIIARLIFLCKEFIHYLL